MVGVAYQSASLAAGGPMEEAVAEPQVVRSAPVLRAYLSSLGPRFQSPPQPSTTLAQA